MDRKSILLVAATAALATLGAIPDARADRLGGNYRGPGDAYRVRQDPATPAEARAEPDPLLAAHGLGRPFLTGVAAGRREAEFRGRPMLVFLVLPGCETCEAVGRKALGNPGVLELAGRFVPVVADVEKEERFAVAHGVKAVPTIVLLDAGGREAGRAEGAVDAARLGALLREVLGKVGAARPTPAAAALERSAALLSRARKAKDWRAVLEAAAAIEKAGHDGVEREEAHAATGEAIREAASGLDEARARLANGEGVAARRALRRIVRDFAGLEESGEAAALLREASRSGASSRGLRPFRSPSESATADPRTSSPRLPVPEIVPPPLTPGEPTREPEPEPDPEPDPDP